MGGGTGMNAILCFVIFFAGCITGIGIVALMAANDRDDKDRNK